MIDQKELDRISSKVRAVQSGRLLVSDRVADHLDDLAELIFAFPFKPGDFDEALQLAPEQTRDHFDRIVELQYLLGQVEEAVGDVPIFDAGKPEMI